jgi:hypothetical protein
LGNFKEEVCPKTKSGHIDQGNSPYRLLKEAIIGKVLIEIEIQWKIK